MIVCCHVTWLSGCTCCIYWHLAHWAQLHCYHHQPGWQLFSTDHTYFELVLALRRKCLTDRYSPLPYDFGHFETKFPSIFCGLYILKIESVNIVTWDVQESIVRVGGELNNFPLDILSVHPPDCQLTGSSHLTRVCPQLAYFCQLHILLRHWNVKKVKH